MPSHHSLPEPTVLISSLQHYIYCPRQCALIHIEKAWDENIYTLKGHQVHKRVNTPTHDLIEDVRVERAMPLWSQALGLTGVADVVEFEADGLPYPVEYKSSARRAKQADEVQLCAQALCLEEMFDRTVPRGAIFHHRSKRRREVLFSETLRSLTLDTIHHVRTLLIQSQLPPPVADQRCPKCSLIDACMPYTIQQGATKHSLSDPFCVEP